MPRIVPIQLLKCLKVLLNDNGGILSTGEVKRISTLMTKYSKKLVSKCIYVQILKCTDTELLDEFMTAGGWGLVFIWLTDGIRLANWPLVQEILELLLLCPVDVARLRINPAPKMVKSLCNGTDEGVCILAKRLVEQWLKIVTEGSDPKSSNQNYQSVPPIPTKLNVIKVEPMSIIKAEPMSKCEERILPEDDDNDEEEEADPLGVPEAEPCAIQRFSPSKIPGKTGLVYKIVMRDGQQLLTKVEPKVETITGDLNDDDTSDMLDDNADIIEEDDEDEDTTTDLVEEDSTSLDKIEDKESGESNSAEEKKHFEKRSTEIKEKGKNESKGEHRSERRKSKDYKSNDYKSDKDREKDKDRKSSSSRRSSSSSTHKPSSSSKSSSSSSSKLKSSSSPSTSSSSSSRRGSSDKGRSDKDRLNSSSSSSKDKDRSSSSKHKSSSSSSSKLSSSSSSSKERHREKDKDKDKEKDREREKEKEKEKSKKEKERDREVQAEKDKDTLAKMLPPSLDKLGKIPKKVKDEREETAGKSTSSSSSSSTNKPTSITIPSKKASMSIEIRRDSEKTNTVKTYKSQFRSHGLTEEAPPPPSRKTLKKPSSSATTTGGVIPSSLPSSLKRPSPPPKDSSVEKKAKIDINQITPAAANIDKPGAIKLIPAKRIQTLVETNIFSDALSAATGPKKVPKRKRPNSSNKDEPGTPTSPDAPKVAPLKFYQDTLDESAKSSNDEKTDKSKYDENKNNNSETDKENSANITDEDDDVPLKKVKEDIEKRVRKEKAAASGDTIDISSDAEDESKTVEDDAVVAVRKPGPGCGPDGPPGVLMLHRRKGPKKKLTWRSQDQLEQIRYFESDENERVNVMKVSFHDMKNMERFNERASLTNLSKRAPRPGDNQEPRTEWRPLIEVEDVPPPPDGAQSKERRVQADREMTTLRALYFSPNMIPDSPSEAEIEPHYPGDPPLIPLDDITGNQDAINDFSGMPWPEPKGSPKQDSASSGTGGLGVLGNPAAEMFPTVLPNNPMSNRNPFANNSNINANFMNPFGPGSVPSPSPNNIQPVPAPLPPPMPPNGWQGPPTSMPRPMMNNPFQGGHSNPEMVSGGPNFMPQHGQFNGPPPPPQFMQNRNGPFGPPPGFNGPNFGPMVPMNNMGPVPLMNGMNNGSRGGNNIRNNGPNWCNGPNNYQDNINSGGNWRPAGTGPNRSGSNNMGGNNGICKAFLRGNCRSGKACKFIHPKNNKRL